MKNVGAILIARNLKVGGKYMNYTALYRKFRPKKFEDIVGQEHITRTLRNQIISNRVGHAYLFNGTRGTGKTSAAKILARAVNCLNPKDGEPCNECEICKAALSGALTDIVEMDAASNNSVDDIRIIRDEVNFLPTLAKYRVYIIDEVHMLSTGAFNALLKTLEEPPAHVKFILATTEPQKLPATILSRCQRFDFKKISDENIDKRLQYICDESKIEITKEALKIIAVLSEGAMRDALSILERCLQEGNNQINEELVKELVGIPKLEYISGITESIINYDVDNALKVVNEVLKQGKDISNLIWEIIKYFKDILVYKTSQTLEIYNEKEITQIKELANNVSKERLLQIIYDLSNLSNEIKWSSQKGLMFQVEIIKLCNKGQDVKNITGLEEINTRLQKLEEQVKNGVKVTKVPVENTPKVDKTVPQNEITKKVINGKEGSTGEKWPNILNNLKKSGKILLYTNLINATPVELNDLVIGIEFKNGVTPFIKSVIERAENIVELEKAISMEYGKEMKIKIIDGKTEQVNKIQSDPIDNLPADLDIPINIIED
ncbi:MAG: DNA polymerase III subunit gamma/tau [Clostridia bacterium]|jgi:DNA polymerase-3 subunit gamma/tau|nr:DNA polymerase III subunit gamma/tau [Clostridia bacterium]HCF65436.1 DNA polymerase III subunit gamma/tau [Clostridiales bacterium]HJJ09711.1 DNA polymerase III subunit gamma/tau [Clostridiaceae bacterium]